MKILIATLFIIAIPIFSYSQNSKRESINPSKYLKQTRIPTNLEECFYQLDNLFPDSAKNVILSKTEEDFVNNAHFGLGTNLRNKWYLWRGSNLTKYFHDLGILHPEDMSGIILTSYYRHLTNKPIELEKQIKNYQEYWRAVSEPKKDIFPKGVNNLQFNSGMYYDSAVNGQGFIHVGTSDKFDAIWLYDYYHGWANVTKSNVRMLEEAKPETRESVLVEIYRNAKR